MIRNSEWPVFIPILQALIFGRICTKSGHLDEDDFSVGGHADGADADAIAHGGGGAAKCRQGFLEHGQIPDLVYYPNNYLSMKVDKDSQRRDRFLI